MGRSLSGMFETRREAELAIEALVQEHGVDRRAITVHTAGTDNTAGTRIAGSDAPSDQPGTRERHDGAHHGEVKLSVTLAGGAPDRIRRALTEAGAHDLRER